MISAKEAANLYENHMKDSMYKQLEDVERMIRENIEKYGNRRFNYYKTLTYDTVSYLHSLGYKVNCIRDPMDGDYYEIEF